MRTIVLALVCTLPVYGGDRITGKPFATRSEVVARNGMAATSQPLATQVALDILKQGGNAIDAAIAANAMQGLCEPTSCGVGGDLFAIVWDGKKLYGLNASGRSPYLLTLDEFKKRGVKHIPPDGPLPVTVPGCVDGWMELHKRFGKLPMSDILAPTIRYAREGVPITDLTHFYWQRSVRVYTNYPGWTALYGGAPKVWKNPELANTLEHLDQFYTGDIAKKIDAYIKREGGFLSYRDLAEHKSEWVEPVSTSYRGYDVWELPPNGQGIAVLQMLNILEPYRFTFGSVEYLHTFIEAKKLVFEDRAKYYGDVPDVPVKQLISKAYAAERRKLINPDRTARVVEAGKPSGDTIYLCVADKDGNMVSLIQSNYRGFGSGLVPDGLGFCLQDRGELFSLEEGQANTYAPHKRPFHTIIPGFVTKDGKPYMAFGVMGGEFQPLGHVQVLMNIFDFGMNLQEAGDAPRISHTGSSEPTGERMTDGGLVHLESGFPPETVRELGKMGHRIQQDIGGYGGYQAIMWDDTNKFYHGASESRSDGQAAGY